MKQEELYQIIDMILNRATFADLEVIEKALQRRKGDGGGTMPGFSPERLSREMASGMEDQLASTREMVRSTVLEFVEKMIRTEAPELNNRQVEELLAAWMPVSSSGKRGKNPSGGTGPGPAQGPALHMSAQGRKLLETMVWQFVDYSIGGMPERQRRELEAELGDWPSRYWDRFPEAIRQLVALFLKGAMDQQKFEAALQEALTDGP